MAIVRFSSNKIDFQAHDDAQAIIDYGLMLVALLASPDMSEIPDGVRLTVWHMIDHAKAILHLAKRGGTA